MARRFPNPTTATFSYAPNPNSNLFSSKQQCLALLNKSSSTKHLNQIHAQILTSGSHRDGFLISEFLRICALSPFSNLTYARSILSHSLNPITSSYNHVIRAYSGSECPKESLLIFVEMRKNGRIPNELTIPFLFKVCACVKGLEEGKQVQVEAIKNGVDENVYVQNSMIHFYGSCKELRDARKVFDEMSVRTVVSWNAIFTSCVENEMLEEAVAVFGRMRGCGFEPDVTTMVIMLSACAELGNLSLGRWVHCQVIENGLLMNCKLGTALVNMYAKCGALSYAGLVFGRMIDRNVWTWSAMILGFAQHGLAKEALKLFADMKNSSIQPNYVTFLGVLCACSHARMVDEGFGVFEDMTRIYGIKPMKTHYGAMVDILSRSGRLEEAYNFILRMPIKPDPIIWRTLLSACSIHDVSDSTGVGMKVRKRLLDLEPRRCGNLVIAANMYAEAGSWEEAARIRRMMKDRGLRKKAGESCIEVDGVIHKFFSGDDARDDCKGLYQSLDVLNLQMKTIDSELTCFPCNI
ncbi:hypothetical protein ACHQM5_006287 [Ranunculus cassubicifolius]